MSKRDAAMANTHRMAEMLRERWGMTTSVEDMAGGCWSVWVKGVEADFYVTAAGFTEGDSGPWMVGFESQGHPYYGTDLGTRFVPWQAWPALVDSVHDALTDLSAREYERVMGVAHPSLES